jgi:hypothetical protein
MDISAVLGNKYVIGAVSGVGGALLMLLTQQILNKRGLFTYFVNHFRVGVSADDAVFGSVRVTWNGNAVANLYSSTVELVNESMKDFEKIVVRAFTNDTILLTERTEIVGTTHIVYWTEEFKKELEVAPGHTPSDTQIDIHSRRRDYLIPVMNRGQVVRFHFLNAARTEKQPSIWLDVLHRGVKLKFQIPQNQILGVAQPRAALVGAILGFLLVGTIIVSINTVWIAALISLVYGFIAQVPGAWTIRAWRWTRESFGG